MIKAENISKIYDKPEKRAALCGVSLVFPDTGLVVVAGESGCGKTTLVNILSGLDTPTSGSVEKDFDVPGAYVFQDNRMIDELTLEENLRLAADITGEKPDISAYLSRYGLEEVKDHTPNRLSAGQNQRAAVLRAVLMNRAVIFADEPTGNLDRENAERVASLLKEESAKRLVITVTHDRELFGKYADRIIELDKGKVIRDDAVCENTGTRTVCAEAKPKLPVRAAMTISGRAMKRSLPRVISTAVVLFICLTFMAVSLNLVFTDFVAAKYGIAAGNGVITYDLGRIAHPETHGEDDDNRESIRSVTDEEFAALSSDFDIGKFRDMTGLQMSAVGGVYTAECDRFYLSDECFFPIVYGNGTIGEREIAVPERVAETLFGSAAEAEGGIILVGDDYGSTALTVSAVYADEIDTSGTSVFAEPGGAVPFDSCVVREETLLGICGALSEAELNVSYDIYRLNGSSAFMTSADANDEYPVFRDFGLSSGRLPETSGEICVHEYGAAAAGLNEGDSIGLKFFQPDGQMDDQRLYTVVGIYTGRSNFPFGVIFSDAEFPRIVYDYSSAHRKEGDETGIALKNHNLGNVRALHELGFCDVMYFSAAARDAVFLTMTLGLGAAVLAAAMAVAALIMSALFAGHLFGSARHTMAALRAAGIGKGGLAALLVMQPLVMLTVSAAATLAVHPVLIAGPLNSIVTSGAGFGFLYVFFPASLVAVGFAALVLVMSLGILLRRLGKRTTADIIYER